MEAHETDIILGKRWAWLDLSRMTVVRFSSPFSKRGLSSQTFIGNKDLIPKTSDLIKKKKLQILSYTLQNCTDWWRQRFFSILFFRGFSFNKNIETCHFSLPIFIISTLLLLSVALCYNLFTPEGITVIEVSENICRKNEDFSKREKNRWLFVKLLRPFLMGFENQIS